jgi:hypothetical protein
MIGLLCFFLAVLASPFKSKLRLEAENAVLRHLCVPKTLSLHGLPKLTDNLRLCGKSRCIQPRATFRTASNPG